MPCKHIAYLPLTPLGDAVVEMGALVELRRLYAPCRITVFAVRNIAELYRNYKYCDEAVELAEDSNGNVFFQEIPKEHFDLIFNHGYCESWTKLLEQMDYGDAFGMEEAKRPPEVCQRLFKRWVSSSYWNDVTLKKYRHVSEQMAELVRLVRPECKTILPVLNAENYANAKPFDFPYENYAILLPGASTLAKCWPIRKYLQLAGLLEKSGHTPVFILGPQDAQFGQAIRNAGFPCVEKLSFAELAYCLMNAAIIIGNDSGPMHFAACIKDSRTVHLFSSSGADTWFQYEEDLHKLVMYDCGRRSGKDCGDCHCVCIGNIPLRKVYAACQSLLDLPDIPFRQIAYFAQDLIGDALVHINDLEELSDFYMPCEITVFCTKNNRSLFDAYAFCDRIFCYEPEKWNREKLLSFHFEVAFNTRYDNDSVQMLRAMDVQAAYGYENIEIPDALCRKVYVDWLPLSIWDAPRLRYNTSVTELGASLIRLVNPHYHCDHISLKVNTFTHDYSCVVHVAPNLVLLIPCASSAYKHWGNNNYLRIADILSSEGYRCLFILGPKECDYREAIEMSGHQVAYCLLFSQIAALMECSKCVVGNDTGLMHLACALDVPSLTISATDSHFVWFPYDQSQHRLCHTACSQVQCSFKCNEIESCIHKIDVVDVINQLPLKRSNHGKTKQN